MKKFAVLLILITSSVFVADKAVAWDDPDPLFCRSYPKKKPFALRWPNLAVCLNAAQPYDEIVGTIEWCRKSYTRMGVDECGRTIQWRATDITYRYVLCNGAYGECFTRTQRDGPVEYVEASCGAKTTNCSKQPCTEGGKVGIFK